MNNKIGSILEGLNMKRVNESPDIGKFLKNQRFPVIEKVLKGFDAVGVKLWSFSRDDDGRGYMANIEFYDGMAVEDVGMAESIYSDDKFLKKIKLGMGKDFDGDVEFIEAVENRGKILIRIRVNEKDVLRFLEK
jgi:hypothetical protein